jgi:hypothetical protein
VNPGDGETKRRPGNPKLATDYRAKGVVYTLAEIAKHRASAEKLLGQSYAPAAVIRLLRQQLGIGPKRARRCVEQVLTEWSRQVDPRQAEKNRALAAERVRDDLRNLRFKKVAIDETHFGWEKRADPNYTAIARMEFLLMRLEGTDQPVKIDVDVRMNEATIGSIAKLSPEQVRGILAEGERTERLAQLAVKRLPESVILEGEFEEAGE